MEYNNFDKLKNASREWLHAMALHDKQYYGVLNTLEYCLEIFDGTRNDSQIEAIHPIGIFQHLKIHHRDMANPVTTYKAILMHDALEDKRERGVSESSLEKVIGAEALEKVILVTKEPNYDLAQYHRRIWDDEVGSLVKGGDRVNNNSTAISIFKPHRLYRYLQENQEYFLPGYKVSRRKFPAQANIYQSFKMITYSQIQAMQRVLENYTPDQK